MHRSRLGKFIDNTAITLIATLIAFSLVRKYIYNNIYALAFASLFGFLVLKILLRFQNKRYSQYSIQKSEVANIEKYTFELRKLSYKSQIEFLQKLLNKENPAIKQDILVIDKIALINFLHLDQITDQNIFEAYSRTTKLNISALEEIILMCNKIDNNSLALLGKFNSPKITVFSPVELYAMMKKYNYFPQVNQEEKLQNRFKFKLFKTTFVRKQAKNFIRCGIILYLTSLFLPFTTYYIIIASICLIIGAICLCFAPKEAIVNPLSKQILL